MFYNNPIELVADKKVMEFVTLKDFYLYIFNILYQQFPNGYIDYKLFLYDNTMLRGAPLGECCRLINRGWEESEGYCIKVQWPYEAQTYDKLTALIRKMARHIAGSYLDLAEFDAAWRMFYQTLKEE